MPIRYAVVVVVLVGVLACSASVQAAPIGPSFDFRFNYNFGRFVFGDFGFWYDNEIVDQSQVTISIPGADDLHGELFATSDSLKSLKTNHGISDYVFGPGKLEFTFDYLLNGVREFGELKADLGEFRTSVDETDWNIWSGRAPIFHGVFDARTAELLGAGQSGWNGYLQVFFDNERRRLGHLGDPQREAAGYGGPLHVEAPEPPVSALLLLGLGAIVRARRRSS